MSRPQKERLQLINGCSCTLPTISPTNWNKAGASVKKDWMVWYRYFDPNYTERYPNGKLCPVKSGVNEYKTLGERRQFIQELLTAEIKVLKEKHWNPVTEKFMIPPIAVAGYIISPESGLSLALQRALEIKKCEPTTAADLKSVLKYTLPAAVKLNLNHMPVKDIRRRHIIMLLEQLSTDKKQAHRKDPKKNKPFTNRTYNYYRAHLSMLFADLEVLEATELNPVEKVPLMKGSKKIREGLSNKERKLIDETLKEENYDFWRVVHMFYHSGSRRTEFLSVKGKDVRLKQQKYKVTVKKKKVITEVWRTIPKAALPYWAEQVKDCGPEEYIVARGMKPGLLQIRPEQLTRRWKRWVKDKFNIDADFYSLKHSNTTDNVNQIEDIIKQAIKIAAEQNSHSPEILEKHYDLNEDRKHNILRESERTFSGK